MTEDYIFPVVKLKPNPIPGSLKYTEFGSLFTVARMGKQSKYPVTDEWILKVIDNIMKYYSTLKKKEIPPYDNTDKPLTLY